MATATTTTESDPSTTLPASFHLLRYPAGAPAREALSRMGLDRPLLASTPGLRFWRLLGTGAGDRMTLSADLRRWALLALWESDAALDEFLTGSAIPRRWDALAEERYDLRLATVRAQGRWGRSTFDVRGAAELPAQGAPVAVLTRAAIRPRRLAAFWRATPGPGLAASAHPAKLASVGIGEVPLVRQATFSLWNDLQGARDYAYRGAAHREVIDRRRAEDWYSSELFARFRPTASSGTWDGTDPLAGRL
ncbi:MAG: hypothetical protein PGN13_07605 [Patulibacter minatonensis]